ncbi:hypothetical protein Taro_039675 [Colocasia esculenta]|uniref:Uncharacterized protein n=1 Tax=Colocasia esculenta TaxID=4460 RepID=A0A843WMW9_COLES|nr:hypothetical protein [Colocasia esculenta]
MTARYVAFKPNLTVGVQIAMAQCVAITQVDLVAGSDVVILCYGAARRRLSGRLVASIRRYCCPLRASTSVDADPKSAATSMDANTVLTASDLDFMASRGRRGGVPAHDGEQRRDEPRREDQGEQQAPAPQGPVLPPPPPVDYGVFMQGLVQAMQTQAHTQAALQAQLEAQAINAACR